MTEQNAKPLEELTMDELDVILAKASSKVVSKSFAEGVPIIYGDAEKTYREWPDGRIEVIHVHSRP
ncbi:hypothetical protein [uncultured Tateyamaria sp.]|uniref:hypothetical protein n=1 Tax=uncultured Tateyamaria sp. TaxID=455651 RepID=UPI00261F01B0|nr:hypothetical protein [uncultured Tateyamaria sp.]